MDCFPACVTCTGLCKREPVKAIVTVRKTRKMRMARAAAIEKNRAGYLHLECDHITTYEEQVIIECFFTKRPKGKYWCEQCGNWQKQMRYKAEVLPQEPGF